MTLGRNFNLILQTITLFAALIFGRSVYSDECVPARVHGKSAKMFDTKDESNPTGVVRRGTEETLRVCALHGKWARVRQDFWSYWMLRSGLVLTSREEALLTTAIPPDNKKTAIRGGECREAIVGVAKAPVFVGSRNVLQEVRSLPLGTPLVVCGEELGLVVVRAEIDDGWIDGWMDPALLRISEEWRPRDLGFRRRRACLRFVWSGVTVRKAQVRRWSKSGKVTLAGVALPGDVLSVVNSGWQGDRFYYWAAIQHDTSGYVEKDDLTLEPDFYTVTSVDSAQTTCIGTWIKARATSDLQLESSAGAGRSLLVIPQGTSFPVLKEPGVPDGWHKASFLGQIGWVRTGGVAIEGLEQSMSRVYVPPPVDPELYMTAPGGSSPSKHRWSVGAGVGVGIWSGRTASPGLEFGAEVALKLKKWLSLSTGLGGVLASDIQTLVPRVGLRAGPPHLKGGHGGPEFGVDIGIAVVSADATAMAFGWAIGAAWVWDIAWRQEFALGYSLRGFIPLICKGECPVGTDDLMHGLIASYRMKW